MGGYKNVKSKSLIEVLWKIKTKRNLKDFVEGILTAEELDQIDQRIKIIKMLKQYKPHHTIARALHVGVATVTRGSKMLKTGHFRYIKNKPQKSWWA